LRHAALWVGIQILAGCGRGSEKERVLIDETLSVESGAFVARAFEVAKDTMTHFAYEVREGWGVDIFLVTESQRAEFETAPLRPWNPAAPSLFRGKAWYSVTRIAAGNQLSRDQSSMILPPGRWAVIVRAIPPEKTEAAEVYVKISAAPQS
jgi:hypothetical protein